MKSSPSVPLLYESRGKKQREGAKPPLPYVSLSSQNSSDFLLRLGLERSQG